MKFILSITLVFTSLIAFSQKVGEVRTFTAKLENFECGDGCYFDFKDIKTNKEYGFTVMQCLYNPTRKKWEVAFNEIRNKCEYEDCNLVGKLYKLTIQYKMVNQVSWDGEQWKDLKKKEKKWVVISLIKT